MFTWRYKKTIVIRMPLISRAICKTVLFFIGNFPGTNWYCLKGSESPRLGSGKRLLDKFVFLSYNVHVAINNVQELIDIYESSTFV